MTEASVWTKMMSAHADSGSAGHSFRLTLNVSLVVTCKITFVTPTTFVHQFDARPTLCSTP